MLKPGLLLILTLASLAEPARAYPSFIGYGYTSCMTCHFNPLGNGPLTDYGRALGATTVSAKPFFAEGLSDEKLAESSGFLGSAKLPEKLKLGADYRGLHLLTGLEANTTSRYIHMQGEASATFIAIEDSLFLSGTFGYAPVPQSVAPGTRGEVSNWISREHYVAVRRDAWGAYAGFLDPAFGLRVPDHNAYIRSRTQLNINDQSHGALLHYSSERWEAGLHGLLGNFFQEEAFRQKGVSGIFEFEPVPSLRLGASVLRTSNAFRGRQLYAIHSRAGIGKGSSILAQLTLIRDAGASQAAQSSKSGDAIFLQTQTRMARGVHVLMTFEHYTDDLSARSQRSYRAGPSLQYFPFQRVELRIDLLGTRSIGATSVNADTFTLQSQVHVWL